MRTAGNMNELEGQVAVGPPDLVLLDVRMPEAYGDDVATVLRAVRGMSVPIYLFSTLADPRTNHAHVRRVSKGTFPSRRGSKQWSRGFAQSSNRNAMDDDLRKRFLGRFLAGARERLGRMDGALAAAIARNTHLLEAELHALSGEAVILGCADLARTCHKAEVETHRVVK